MMHKRKIWVGLLLASGLFVLPLWQTRVEIFRDHRIVVEEKRTLVNYIAVHSSPPKYISIYGRSFEGIRGLPPYYIEIKPLNAILFVTEERSNRVSFCLAYEHTETVVQIPGGSSGFGWNIGTSRAAGENMTDYVEASDAKHIILSRRGLDWKEITTISIQEKRVESVKTIYDRNKKL